MVRIHEIADCKGDWFSDTACGYCDKCKQSVPDARGRNRQLKRQVELAELSRNALLHRIKRLEKLNKDKLRLIKKLKHQTVKI